MDLKKLNNTNLSKQFFQEIETTLLKSTLLLHTIIWSHPYTTSHWTNINTLNKYMTNYIKCNNN